MDERPTLTSTTRSSTQISTQEAGDARDAVGGQDGNANSYGVVVALVGVGVVLVTVVMVVALIIRQRRKLSLGVTESSRTIGMRSSDSGRSPTTELPDEPVTTSPLPIEETDFFRTPAYWEHQMMRSPTQDAFCKRCEVTDAVSRRIQLLMDSTFRDIETREGRLCRKEATMPCRLRLETVQRVENEHVWHRYIEERRRIKLKRGHKCTPLVGVGGVSGPLEQLCEEGVLTPELQVDVNEVYLWHGTSLANAVGIVNSGFDLKLSGTGAGSSMYGSGVYLAECSSKSDEYCYEGSEPGVYCLLLCRAVMGQNVTMPAGGPATHQGIKQLVSDGAYDSVLGDREAAVGTYREFVVYSEAQIYPEYVIMYRRESELHPVPKRSTEHRSHTA